MSWPALQSLIASVIPSELRQRYFGVNFTLLNLGIGIGGVIGGLVRRRRPTCATFQAIYLADAASATCPALLLLLGPLRHVAGAGRRDHAPTSRADGLPRGAPQPGDGHADACSASSSSFVGYSQLNAGMPAFARARRRGLDPRARASRSRANTLVIVLLQLVVLQRIEGRRRTRVIAVMGVVWALSWLLLGLSGPGPRHPGRDPAGRRVRLGLRLRRDAAAADDPGAGQRPRARPPARALQRAQLGAFQLAAVIAPPISGLLIGHALGDVYIGLLVVGCLVCGVARHRPARAAARPAGQRRRDRAADPSAPPVRRRPACPSADAAQRATSATIRPRSRRTASALLPVGLDQDRQHRRAEVDGVVRLAGARGRGRRDGGPARPAAGAAAGAPAPAGRGGPGAVGRRRAGSGRRPARRPPAGCDVGRRRPAVGAAGSAAAGRRSPSRCSRQATNCPSSLSETSCMTPRPNCAGLPVTARSVTTSTSVPPTAADGHRERDLGAGGAVAALVLALGVDDEPVRRLVLLHEGARAVVDQRDRAELDLAPMPLKVSPSAEVTWAPGKHSATDAMSWKCAQVSSTGGGDGEAVREVHQASDPRGGEHGAPGQHAGQVAAVVGVAVEVRGRVGALGRPLGRGPDRRRRWPAARPAPPRRPGRAAASSPCWSARPAPRRWCRPRRVRRPRPRRSATGGRRARTSRSARPSRCASGPGSR